MKKLICSFAILGLLFTTSCKKDTVKETTIESDPASTTVTTTTTTEQNYDPRLEEAELKLKNAERELQIAKDKGDAQAEAAAQKIADDAKTSWERTKTTFEEAGRKTGEAIDRAGEKSKENYNEALEKAKIK